MGYTPPAAAAARRAAARRAADHRRHPARERLDDRARDDHRRSSGDTFGGLGFFISEGLQTFFPTEILLGAVPVGRCSRSSPTSLLVRVQRRVTPWARDRARAGGALMDRDSSPGSPTRPTGRARPGIPIRLVEHLAICRRRRSSSATLIALPIGLSIGHTGRGADGRDQPRQHRPGDPVARGHRHRRCRSRCSCSTRARARPASRRSSRWSLLAIPPILVERLRRARARSTATWSRPARGMGMRERQILRRRRDPARARR